MVSFKCITGISSNEFDGVQLNLKNDTLRRRFDSLKYDLKKIEEGGLTLRAGRILQSLTTFYSCFIQWCTTSRSGNWHLPHKEDVKSKTSKL